MTLSDLYLPRKTRKNFFLTTNFATDDMKNALLVIEFIILFVLVPLLLVVFRFSLRRMVIPLLILFCISVLLFLLFDKTFDKKLLWKTENFLKGFKNVLLRFISVGLLLSIFCYFLYSSQFLYLPKSHSRLWIFVMIFYPLASVYPQEIIYRVFFFHRYKTLYRSRVQIIWASGICFGLAHLFFLNVPAILLGTLGGLMFSYTYAKSNSVILSSLEHALWGDLIFTVGLGIYFYSGAIQ